MQAMLRVVPLSVRSQLRAHRRMSTASLPAEAVGTAAPVTDAALACDSLDLRVGRVVRAWRHPEADKLFVEEVDCGEPSGPRTICSGLVGYVEESSLANRLVVVLANLKARNMVGVKSFGMLLAASDEAHENVALLSPPEGAVVGERVRFGDGPQAPADSENKVQKKKLWEAVQPDLRTTAEGAAEWKGLPMLTSAGAVKATLLNGRIS